MSTPRLSVIMGAYQIGRLSVFDAAADSVLHQNMDDFEFIICDDGSTDNTALRLQRLAEKDIRIRLIYNSSNEGLAASLNHCLSIAQGEFIARQDADDLSDLTRFAKQLAFLEAHPEISFVGTDLILYDESGDWGKRQFPVFPQPKDFMFTLPFIHGSLMFRKQDLMAVGGYRVAKETRRTEDYDLLMRLYAQGMHGANINEPLYHFLEDRSAMQRRKYRYRIDEAKVKYQGFAALNLLPYAMPYIIKPLVVGLLPIDILKNLKFICKRKF